MLQITHFDRYADELLPKIKDGNPYSLYFVIQEIQEMEGKDEYPIFIDYLEQRGLVVRLDQNNHRISEFGYHVNTHRGGWISYLKEEYRKEQTKKRQLRLQARVTIGTSVAAVLISAVSIIIDVSQSRNSNGLERELTQQKRVSDSLSKLTDSRLQLLETKRNQTLDSVNLP